MDQTVGRSYIHSLRSMLPVLLFLAFGLLTGTALPGLLQMGTGSYAGLASSYSFRVFENRSVNIWELFLYVGSVRMPVLLVLWMSSFTTLGIFFHLAYAWWLVASGGMLLALFAQSSGFQGGVSSFAAVFFRSGSFTRSSGKKKQSSVFAEGVRHRNVSAGRSGSFRKRIFWNWLS